MKRHEPHDVAEKSYPLHESSHIYYVVTFDTEI